MDEIGTFLDFHLLNEGLGLQPGAEFEKAFYKQIKSILKQQKGSFKLKIQNKTYTVTNVYEPAGAATTKADLLLDVLEGDGKLYISLKQAPFPAYAGIADKKRNYLAALSNSSAVANYIDKLKRYLIANGTCVFQPKLPLPKKFKTDTGYERRWLELAAYRTNKNKQINKAPLPNTLLNSKQINSVDISSAREVVCSRNYREFFWIPEGEDQHSFNTLVIFGDPSFKAEKDYADYVLKGPKGTTEPFIQKKPGLYVVKPEISVLAYGDDVSTDEQLKPVFFSRTMKGRHNYGLINTRTQIVPYSEVKKRNQATLVQIK